MKEIIEEAVKNHYKERLYALVARTRSARIDTPTALATVEYLYNDIENIRAGLNRLTIPEEIKWVPQALMGNCKLLKDRLDNESGVWSIDHKIAYDRIGQVIECICEEMVAPEKVNEVSQQRIEKKVEDMYNKIGDEYRPMAEELVSKIKCPQIRAEVADYALEVIERGGDITIYFAILESVHETDLYAQVYEMDHESIGIGSIIHAAANAAIQKKRTSLEHIISGMESHAKTIYPQM